MIDSGVAGLVFGAYLLSGRNLWAAILAHGLVDTAGVCLLRPRVLIRISGVESTV